MSLIIETLNKIEDKGFKNYVPPSLLKSNKNKTYPKKAFIYIGLFLSISFPTIYLSQYLGDISHTKVTTTNLNVKEIQPIPIAEDISKISPVEVVLNKIPEINLLEKELNQLDSLNILNSVFHSVNNSIEKLPIPEITNKNTEKHSPFENNLEFEFNSFVSIAESYLKEKDIQNSIQWYEKAYRLKKDEYVLNQLLNLYLQVNSWETLNSIISKLENEKIIYSFLTQLVNNNQIQLADKIISQKIKFDKNGYLFYLNGIILETKGNTEKAELSYRIAYQKNKADPYLVYSYGRILEINKKYEDALNIYLQAEKLDIDNNLKSIITERISILRGNFVF